MVSGGQQAGPREVRARRGAAARALRALDRDARAPALLDAPAGARARVRGLRVVVVGLGSIGASVADLLARASVASLLLVDRGCIKPESVLTHPVLPTDVGRPKATLAGERAKAVSPETRVRVYDGPVEDLGPAAFVGASAVLLASDNLACELEVGQRCLHLGVPLIQGSVHGATLVAQVRALAHAPEGDRPCVACGYQAADWQALDRGTRFSCDGGPAQASAAPTVSPAQLCSTAASLAVTELLGRASGLVPTDASRLVDYCGFTHGTSVTPLRRRAACPVDHAPWRVEAWPHPLGGATPRALFAAAGCEDEGALAEVSLTVTGHRFSSLAACACPAHPRLGRFRPRAAVAAPCPTCGAPLEGHPFYSHDDVPGLALRAHLDEPLATLGAADPTTVLVRRAGQVLLVHVPLQVRR